jgi:hypothetical protein
MLHTIKPPGYNIINNDFYQLMSDVIHVTAV